MPDLLYLIIDGVIPEKENKIIVDIDMYNPKPLVYSIDDFDKMGITIRV